ncbi:MAG: RHS repeat domain-containing protein [Chitinophagales bacterium]
MRSTYPFGMPMPNRQYSLSSSKYRFGFNGKEKDDEVYGEGNFMNYDARLYDSRLGKFISVDPWVKKYPSASPYSAFNNNPLYFIDPTGKGGVATVEKDNSGKTFIKVTTVVYIYTNIPNMSEEELKSIATQIESDVNCDWNKPANFSTSTGQFTETKAATNYAGEMTPMVFETKVIAVSPEKAQEQANKLNPQDNFFEIVPEGQGSETYMDKNNKYFKNSGKLDIGDIKNRNGTTQSHEMGHIFDAFFEGNDQETHNNKPMSIMGTGISGETSSTVAHRRVSSSDIKSLNKGEGFKSSNSKWSQSSINDKRKMNFGAQPSKNIKLEGKPTD